MNEDEQQVGLSGAKLDAWRGYFQAAISGMLAAGQLDPRSASVPELVAESCAKVADAALLEDARRQD